MDNNRDYLPESARIGAGMFNVEEFKQFVRLGASSCSVRMQPDCYVFERAYFNYKGREIECVKWHYRDTTGTLHIGVDMNSDDAEESMRPLGYDPEVTPMVTLKTPPATNGATNETRLPTTPL